MEVLLEDEIIDHVILWLEKDAWTIEEFCKGKKRGIDIRAKKDDKIFIIEAKGGRGNPNHKHTTRKKFDKGQIKIHLGAAVLKVLHERKKYQNSNVAIALPGDEYTKNIVSVYIEDFKTLGIKFLFVETNGNISVEN